MCVRIYILDAAREGYISEIPGDKNVFELRSVYTNP